MKSYDIVVIGSGIAGLSCAYHLAQNKLKVAVIEKNNAPKGASIQNFGLIWPIGQAKGENYQLALRSRDIWIALSKKANFFINPCGSLHIANEDDEWNVLQEYYLLSSKNNQKHFSLLSKKDIANKHNMVNASNLKGALYSSYEMSINPSEAINNIAKYLKEVLQVSFYNHCLVSKIENKKIYTNQTMLKGEHIIVCSGNDFSLLHHKEIPLQKLITCKLQMMKTIPYKNIALNTVLSGGLTLRHYPSFQHCPSIEKLKKRIAEQHFYFDKYGIHVMVVQNNNHELIIGDSHEYGNEIDPFNKSEVNNYILTYLKTFFKYAKPLKIAQYWNGHYLKYLDKSYLVSSPNQYTTILNGLGGNGMTLSWALAENIANDIVK